MSKLSTFEFNFIKLCSYNIRHWLNCSERVSWWIASQFALESNFGRSHLVDTNLNFMGMKVPKRRPTSSGAIFLDANPKFATYDTFDQNVVDYGYWLAYNGCTQKIYTEVDRFRDFVKSHGYCPSESYINRVNNIYNSYCEFYSEYYNVNV